MSRPPGPSDRRGGGVAALLVLTALSVISVDVRSGEASPFDGARSAVAGFAAPLHDAVSAVAVPRSRPDVASDEQVAELRAMVAELTAQAAAGELHRARVAELDELLRLTGAGQYRTVPARVVGVAPAQHTERTVLIDAGTIDGITVDMSVVNGDGLVGRVVESATTTATVQLIVDPRAQLGARLEGSLELGIARGAGDALELELLDALAPMRTGDRVVTFGSPGGRPYVPGVPVGELTSVQAATGAATRTAALEPYVDFTALDLVGVVVEPPRTDPRDAVLPPQPAAVAGVASDPAVTTDPAGSRSDPAGLSSDPAGLSSDPTGLSSDPTGLSADPAGLP